MLQCLNVIRGLKMIKELIKNVDSLDKFLDELLTLLNSKNSSDWILRYSLEQINKTSKLFSIISLESTDVSSLNIYDSMSDNEQIQSMLENTNQLKIKLENLKASLKS